MNFGNAYRCPSMPISISGFSAEIGIWAQPPTLAYWMNLLVQLLSQNPVCEICRNEQ